MSKIEAFKCDYEKCQSVNNEPWIIVNKMQFNCYINDGHQMIEIKNKHFCNFYCLENQIALIEDRIIKEETCGKQEEKMERNYDFGILGGLDNGM